MEPQQAQPAAIGGKSLGRKNGRNRPKPLPWFATDGKEGRRFESVRGL
jgi:hypothetical protein